jgi:hypothetical protein
MKTKIEFPKPKKIDYRKYIQPMKQEIVTIRGNTIAILVNI